MESRVKRLKNPKPFSVVLQTSFNNNGNNLFAICVRYLSTSTFNSQFLIVNVE